MMAKTFKELLHSKGYSTPKFAKAIGISKRSLEAYTTGKSFKKSQLWFALKVADALDIDPHELLELNKEENK